MHKHYLVFIVWLLYYKFLYVYWYRMFIFNDLWIFFKNVFTIPKKDYIRLYDKILSQFINNQITFLFGDQNLKVKF